MEHYLSEYFFTDYAMVGVNITALFIGKKRRKLHPELNPIFSYLLLSLAIDISTFYTMILSERSAAINFIEKITTLLFVIGEFGLFLLFIHQNIENNYRKKVIKILFIIFVSVVAVVASSNFNFEVTYAVISTLDSASLLIASFFYFYELFLIPRFVDIKNHPSFWVALAILFFSSCSLPVYIFQMHIRSMDHFNYRISYSLIYILYILAFLLFIKAYLCKNTRAQS